MSDYNVNGWEGDMSRGAAMGQPSYGDILGLEKKSIQLYRVHIDSEGYDKGGSYWGLGKPLYHAVSDDFSDYQRAYSREEAANLMGLTSEYLIRGIGKGN